MASQNVFIDLINSEAEHKDFGSHQDKSASKNHSAAPVYTVLSLILSTSLIQNAQEGSSLYSLALQKALDGLEGMDKEKERGDKPPGYMAGTTQQREKDKLAKLMEARKRDLNFLLFDGTLTGSDLMWYTMKDTKEWVSWNHLANSFLEQYDNKLKRKIIEPVMEEVMMHNKFDQAKPQSKDKGKVMIKPPKFKARKPQVITQLAKPPAVTFEMLRSHGILLPKNDGIPNPLRKDFDPNKHCSFHSGMQGHDTNECRHLKKEIRKLIISGRISQRPRPQLIRYKPPEIIPTSNYTPTYHPPFTMRLSV
ncbi:hypothetical protein HAX54_037729 [Datura stramonium]|uniref:Uncharacterized protein n=1 Tax=Datura stramonium TaxID=4076 RepID=A0ABS8SH64_DATST|nr:hypothetical protein [Datura stramonium]